MGPWLWDRFAERFGYRLRALEDQIDSDPDLHATTIVRRRRGILRVLRGVTAICHKHGQLQGPVPRAPTDLLGLCRVDIPESEAILFPPILLADRGVGCALSGGGRQRRTFTCLYGFITPTNIEPYRYWRREQVADLKLLADALFAQGVNQIVWHGMPFNGPGGRNEFYATVHVGPDAAFAADLPAFNAYLERVSSPLTLGRTESRLAVYLPNEDNRRLDFIPDVERTPGAAYRWEMRHVIVPRAIEGYAPLWISPAFLRRAEVSAGRLRVGVTFSALLVDVVARRRCSAEVVRLADAGLWVFVPPCPAGEAPRAGLPGVARHHLGCRNVVRQSTTASSPLVDGDDIPPFWDRRTANPSTSSSRLKARDGLPDAPLASHCPGPMIRRITIDGWNVVLDRLSSRPYHHSFPLLPSRGRANRGHRLPTAGHRSVPPRVDWLYLGRQVLRGALPLPRRKPRSLRLG